MDRFIDTKLFANVMRRISKALSKYRWAMIGGRAVEVHANPPQTPDVDCIVVFKSRDMNVVIKAMNAEGFELDRKFFEPNFAPMLFFSDTKNKVEVDLIGAFEDLQFWAVDRAEIENIGGVKFPVATAEDIVILKSAAAVSERRGEKAERDKAAIQAIDEEVDLDIGYIETALLYSEADRVDELALLKKLVVLEE